MEEKLKQQPSDCLKVVLYGPESTGKTTLAQWLAEHYQTVYVPEFSRSFALERKRQNKPLTKEDVMPIAIGQMALENRMAKEANHLLICDTDLLETKVYSEVYYGGVDNASLERFAVENHYDLYFLSYIDLPWIADEIRDRPTDRAKIFEQFERTLLKSKKPYVLLQGSLEERFELAKRHIDELIQIKG